MQAVDRFFESQNWLTFFLAFLIITIFVLRALSVEKLAGYFVAPFYKGFVDIEFEERVSIFNPFYVVLYIFSISTIILFGFVITQKSNIDLDLKESFIWFYGFGIGYFLLKKILEKIIKATLNLPFAVNYYLFTKSAYLYSIAFYTLIGLIFFRYTNASFTSYLFFLFCCLVVRYFTLFINNKNLIFNYLFYFILYFCAFEIAPLFILYKMML